MSRLPIRGRLTAAFVIAVAVVVAGAGLFVYLRLQSDLDDAIDDSLAKRAGAIASPPGRSIDALDASSGRPADRQDGFSLVVDSSGQVIDSSGGYQGRALSAAELKLATRATVTVQRRLPGIDGTTRILARAAPTRDQAAVVVVSQSLEDRDETLSGLVKSFSIGGPIAILITSLMGYGIASAGFAPIEAMRRRAGEISLARADEELPLPEARDEVRRLGETLNQMLGRLRAAFERERSFVADASHELRTPIAVIKVELEAALRSRELGPSAREAVVCAVEECDSLAALAEDLLVIARTGQGELPMKLQSVSAEQLLAGVKDRFIDRARERDREILVVADGTLELLADPSRLRQALGNLVDNALRHGDGEIELRAERMAGGVALTVSDCGGGFDPAIASRAFERFARGEAARTRDGSGLGLAIVRAIAEAHRGTAEIDSSDGVAVRIWLPPAPV